MTPLIRSFLPSLAFASVLLGATPYVRAGGATEIRPLDPAVTLHFSDLNPGTPAGVAALYARIEDAAQTVCGPSFSLWNADTYRNWKKCYRSTIDRTVRQINLPLLTALHQSGRSALQAATVGSEPGPTRPR